MAAWLKRWDNSKIPNCEKFTLSAQSSSAFQRTPLCQASLIEDLSSNGFKFVLTARFQSHSQTKVWPISSNEWWEIFGRTEGCYKE